MSEPLQTAARVPEGEATLPEVRLEVQHGSAHATTYTLNDLNFLIGTVPGCDVRVPGADLPPLLCVIARRLGGATVRKLAPTMPLLHNDGPLTSAPLQNGDRLTLGTLAITLHITAGVPALPASEASAQIEVARRQLHAQLQTFREEVLRFQREHEIGVSTSAEKQQALERREQELEERSAELEQERIVWYQRRAEIERECQQQAEELARLRMPEAQAPAEVQAPAEPQPCAPAAPEQAEQLRQLEESLLLRSAELEKQRQEHGVQRQELADLRRQLHDRYQERRDRLAGLQEAVNRAARKVQERKQLFDAEELQAQQRRQEEAARRAELAQQQQQLQQHEQQVAAERQHLAQLAEQLRLEQQQVSTALEQRERQLTEAEARHQAALFRLDRLQGNLEERERVVQTRTAELESRAAQLQQESQQQSAQLTQLNEGHTRLSALAEQLGSQKREQEENAARLQEKAAALEGQQAMLTNLRARLERMREEIRAAEQQVTDDRARLTAQEQTLGAQQAEAQRLRSEAEQTQAVLELQRRQLSERASVLETAVSQLRQAQANLAAGEERVRIQTQELEARAAELASSESLLQARASQSEELLQRLESERAALRERATLLAQTEQAREALQEQLRRRSDELAARQKAVAELQTQYEADAATQQQLAAQVAVQLQEIEQRNRDFAQQHDALRQGEAALAASREKLQANGRAIAAAKKELYQERQDLEAQRVAAAQAATQARQEHEAGRSAALALQEQLPDLELRAGNALDRLSFAREQLREHIAEIHTFSTQCQDHLDVLRNRILGEGEKVQVHEHALRKTIDEQRLAVVNFRQQMIDWQGKLAEMRRALSEDESRLERRHAQLSAQAEHVDAETQRLAEEAEQLQQERTIVSQQRGEMTQHLNDMRDWYRRKLRELAGIDTQESTEKPRPAGRAILSLVGDVEPGDRQLGDLLRSLALVEPDTLDALLLEARRQRRSLRQVLLASGTITLYQLALIEAGQLDALILGPVRVVDRLGVTPHEAIYRVFDPRGGREAILRHLAESEMLDAVRPDELRQRFAQAQLTHPNISVVYEVLEIAERPAALLEWLPAVPSSDWPTLTAVPGVWFRLVQQAALALHTAHHAGLVHGHLQASDLVLTPDGVLKLCNLGEPPWLADAPESWDEPARDLQALGAIIAGWASAEQRPGPKVKPLPEALQAVSARLTSSDAAVRYASAEMLLADLEELQSGVPANSEAWERLLRQLRDHLTGKLRLRESA